MERKPFDLSAFEPRILSDEQITQVRQIRDAFKAAAEALLKAANEGRYRSLALTALEEGCMWAVKSVSQEIPG
jgi:hypothetical protein